MKTIKLNLVKKISLLLLAVVLMPGCDVGRDDENTCASAIYTGVSGVTGPETAAVNEAITLTTSFAVKSSCGSFGTFAETVEGNTKTITVVVQYNGCKCDELSAIKTAPYVFKSSVAGTYVLKFKITDTTFVTKTIVVS